MASHGSREVVEVSSFRMDLRSVLLEMQAALREAVITPEAAYLADALTGATWTARGVTNLLRFWLGDHGFGPFLSNIRNRRG